jgi:hypothetical protein
MRFLAAALLLFATPAQAFQPCPHVGSGWAISYAAPITSITYDQYASFMYVIWASTFPTAYVGMPVAIMSSISRIADPVLAYNQYIKDRYPSLFLQEENDCPVLNENGEYISTNGLSLNPIPYPVLLKQSGGPILQQNGQVILLYPTIEPAPPVLNTAILQENHNLILLEDSSVYLSLY